MRILLLTLFFFRFPSNTIWFSFLSIWSINCQIMSSDHWTSGMGAAGAFFLTILMTRMIGKTADLEGHRLQ